MFGYACRETPVLMPAPIYYAHEILKSLSKARHGGEVPDLGPDMKSQVTLEYRDGQPVRATSVVVSAQHSERVDQDFVRKLVLPPIQTVLPAGWMPAEDELYITDRKTVVSGKSVSAR